MPDNKKSRTGKTGVRGIAQTDEVLIKHCMLMIIQIVVKGFLNVQMI